MCLKFTINMKTVYLVLFFCYNLGHFSKGTFVSNGTNNANVKKRFSYVTDTHLTQNERNRRLIPYTTYYIAENRERGSTLQLEHEMSNKEEPASRATTPKSKRPIIVDRNAQKISYDYVNYQHPQIAGYNYVPIAYTSGSAILPAYDINSEHYNSIPENVTPHTTLRPIANPINIEKKAAIPFLSQLNTPSLDNYVKYVVPDASMNQKLATLSEKINKPPFYSSTLPTNPQLDYSTFRYSEAYKTQPHAKPSSTTPLVVEITSSKHYINSNAASTVPNKINIGLFTTPSYSLAYNYPETAQFAYSAPLTPSENSNRKPKPINYAAEQEIQSMRRVPPQIQNNLINSREPSYQIDVTTKLPANTNTDIPDFTLDDIFEGLNINKQLPERITPGNIKESIKTLSYVLQMLQKADSISQLHERPTLYSKNLVDHFKDSYSLLQNKEHKSINSLQNVDTTHQINDIKDQLLANKFTEDEHNAPGRAGVDYPIYSIIPETTFSCKTQRYKGFFADPETKCQVWHYCDLNGGHASFLCPNGTIFNQAALTCDWWFNVKCASTPQLYVLNERLYKYIIPIRPSFPEDFSGPLVDRYLTEKFREAESHADYKYPNNSSFSASDSMAMLNSTNLSEYNIPTHLLNEQL